MAHLGTAFVLAYRTAGSLVWVVVYQPTVRTLVLIGFIAYLMRTKTSTSVDRIDTPPEPSTAQEGVRALKGVRPCNPHAAAAPVQRGCTGGNAWAQPVACCFAVGSVTACDAAPMRHRRHPS